MAEFAIYSYDEGWQHNPSGLLTIHTTDGIRRRSMRIDAKRRKHWLHFIQCSHLPQNCPDCGHYHAINNTVIK